MVRSSCLNLRSSITCTVTNAVPTSRENGFFVQDGMQACDTHLQGFPQSCRGERVRRIYPIPFAGSSCLLLEAHREQCGGQCLSSRIQHSPAPHSGCVLHGRFECFKEKTIFRTPHFALAHHQNKELVAPRALKAHLPTGAPRI